MGKIGDWVSCATVGTIQWGIRTFRGLVCFVKNPIVASVIAFGLFFSVLYIVDSDNDVVEIIGVIANFLLAAAVFRIQYIPYRREIKEKRNEEIKKVLSHYMKKLGKVEKPNAEGEVRAGTGDHGQYTTDSSTGKRYLFYWKFESFKSLDKIVFEVAVRHLLWKTGNNFFGTTIVVSVETTGHGSAARAYRNDSNPCISEEKGRKSVEFGDFSNSEWEVFMHIMQGALFNYITKKYP